MHRNHSGSHGVTIQPFVSKKLGNINKLLAQGSHSKLPPTIDEMLVISDQGEAVFSVIGTDWEIHPKGVLSIVQMDEYKGISHGSFGIIPPGKVSPDVFMFFTTIDIIDSELGRLGRFYSFGRSIHSSLDELQSTPRWNDALKKFFRFSEMIGHLMYKRPESQH